MALTAQEEKILKLFVEQIIARTKLNAVNKEMGDAIRAEFNAIDTAKREEYRPQYEPLESQLKTIQSNLESECE